MGSYKKLIDKIYKEYNTDDIISISYILAEHAATYNTDIQNKARIVSALKKDNIVTQLDNENVILKQSKIFKINNSDEVSGIYKKIKKAYPLINVLVWNTDFLSDLMLHQVFSNIIVVEVESMAKDSVFAFLIENYDKKYSVITDDIFANDTIPYFTKKRIVIKSMKSESPKLKYDNKYSPKIEKLLVDLYIDKMFIAYQGKELEYIYENTFNNYDINLKTLYRYARVRGKREELKKYILKLNIDERYKL